MRHGPRGTSAMTPVAPVRCPPCETVRRESGMGISEMRLRGSGNTVHALYAWGRPPCRRVRCQFAVGVVYLLTRIGAPATLDRTGWAAKLCSDVRLQRCYGRAKTNGSTEPPSSAAGDRPCRGPPLGLGVARTRTTRAVADGSTVPLFLCTESFRELF